MWCRGTARLLAVGVLSVLAGLVAPAASGAVGTVTPSRSHSIIAFSVCSSAGKLLEMKLTSPVPATS